jgi:cytoplasmic iron level regulating protein YaaA (DUF328/UPF0246 family)
MLYTLFSPSEAKQNGGNLPTITPKSFIFPSLYKKRLELLEKFEEHKKTLDEKALLDFFELKMLEETSEYRQSIFDLPCDKALLRYSGVAYKALDFYSLSLDAKKYIFEQTIIFSNLFGPLLGGDEIPNYRLKQGEKISGIDAARHYKKEFSISLDAMFDGCELLDLRAGYYEKFYEPKVKILKPKFLKNGKIVSHNAKEHRGLFLREIALAGVFNIDDIMKLPIKNLKLVEVIQKNNCMEPIFETAFF